MRFLPVLLAAFLPLMYSYGQTQSPRIKVLLLGTFHFGKTPDKGKTPFPDLFSAKRQQELGTIAAKLKGFGVDKFFVEKQFTQQARTDSLFALYRQGRLTDTVVLRDESIQIGFRTAKLTGCRLVAADNRQELPYDKLEAYAKRHENDTTSPYPLATVKYPFSKSRKTLRESTLSEYYVEINNATSRQKSLYDYLHYALFYGEGTEFIGEELTLSWYDRNLKIFTNILRNINPEQDKEIVVLFGSSHTAVLRQFFENHPFFEVVEVDQVLLGKQSR